MGILEPNRAILEAYMTKVKELLDKEVIRKSQVPQHFPESIHYEVIMGSYAYGVSKDSSDIDVYGFAIPPKQIIFPHLAGFISGFGQQPEKFEQWQLHHLVDGSTEYDFSIYNIVKYFSLVMSNNPNMVDSLFVPDNCILYESPIAKMVREKALLFLHKGSYHTFKGYAYQQLSKLKVKNPTQGPRLESVQKYGYDVKFAYHIVRLIDEVDQILNETTLVLGRNADEMKAVRNGEWSLERVEKFFDDKLAYLEKSYAESTLQHSPNEKLIKELLLNCLEQQYGSLSDCGKF